MSVRVGELLAVLDEAYPPTLAEPWDTGIGLTCGDPDADVDRVLLAVDADEVTVEEAAEIGAQVLLTHHPLLFRPVQSVAASTTKGALLHRLIQSGIAHVAAHTNADRASCGVSDALATALGMTALRPLVPAPGAALEKVVVFVPLAEADAMVAALSAAGAGQLGDYAEAAFTSTGMGRFRPLPGAHPAIGEVGVLETVTEARIEMVLPAERRAQVVTALRAAHPYEEPAFDIYRTVAPGSADSGLGRIGELVSPVTLAAFATLVAARLPATVAGVRAAGDPDRLVRTVAVCGGAGDSEMAAATAAGVDVYLTSDLRHHIVAEHLAGPRRPAVVEVAHWAGEWPWLVQAATVIQRALPGSVATTVSTKRTDPWTVHCPSPKDSAMG